MANFKKYVEYTIYIVLLFFFVPIKIKNTDTEDQFKHYLEMFNKTYSNETIYLEKLGNFKESLRTIEKLNKNKTENSARYGLTKFSDLTSAEFSNTFLKHNLHQKMTINNLPKYAIDKLPKVVDWRRKNVVTKVRNQGDCGACWAFTAVETIESVNAIKTGKLEEFSVQEMISCAGYGNKGCYGGNICSLLQWLKDYGIKIRKAADFHADTPCYTLNNGTIGSVEIDKFTCDNLVGNEEIILRHLAEYGPLAVAVNAITWQNYVGGVIKDDCNSEPLNHAVQIVGYNLQTEVPYYIARNSWGEDFGDGGYLYLAIGENLCGLASQITGLILR